MMIKKKIPMTAFDGRSWTPAKDVSVSMDLSSVYGIADFRLTGSLTVMIPPPFITQECMVDAICNEWEDLVKGKGGCLGFAARDAYTRMKRLTLAKVKAPEFKTCCSCGKTFKRKIFKSGQPENITRYEKRKACSQECHEKT